MKIKSLSFTMGSGCLQHNNRISISKNVHPELSKNNIYVVNKDLEDVYYYAFGKAITDYNKYQSRESRQLTVEKYLAKLKLNKNGQLAFHEIVVQIGDAVDTNIFKHLEDANIAAKILKEYAQEFQTRNPNLFVVVAAIHMDETVPHLHLDFVPVADGYKKGLSIRNSLSKAFCQSGFSGVKAKKEWIEREKESIKAIALNYGIKIVSRHSISRRNLRPEQYIAGIETVQKIVDEGLKAECALNIKKIMGFTVLDNPEAMMQYGKEYEKLHEILGEQISFAKDREAKATSKIKEAEEELQNIRDERYEYKRQIQSLEVKLSESEQNRKHEMENYNDILMQRQQEYDKLLADVESKVKEGKRQQKKFDDEILRKQINSIKQTEKSEKDKLQKELKYYKELEQRFNGTFRKMRDHYDKLKKEKDTSLEL